MCVYVWGVWGGGGKDMGSFVLGDPCIVLLLPAIVITSRASTIQD